MLTGENVNRAAATSSWSNEPRIVYLPEDYFVTRVTAPAKPDCYCKTWTLGDDSPRAMPLQGLT